MSHTSRTTIDLVMNSPAEEKSNKYIHNHSNNKETLINDLINMNLHNTTPTTHRTLSITTVKLSFQDMLKMFSQMVQTKPC